MNLSFMTAGQFNCVIFIVLSAGNYILSTQYPILPLEISNVFRVLSDHTQEFCDQTKLPQYFCSLMFCLRIKHELIHFILDFIRTKVDLRHMFRGLF